jgi:hypothetical protein
MLARANAAPYTLITHDKDSVTLNTLIQDVESDRWDGELEGRVFDGSFGSRSGSVTNITFSVSEKPTARDLIDYLHVIVT